MLRRRGLPLGRGCDLPVWWRRRSRSLGRRNGLPLRRRGLPLRGRSHLPSRGRRGRGSGLWRTLSRRRRHRSSPGRRRLRRRGGLGPRRRRSGSRRRRNDPALRRRFASRRSLLRLGGALLLARRNVLTPCFGLRSGRWRRRGRVLRRRYVWTLGRRTAAGRRWRDGIGSHSDRRRVGSGRRAGCGDHGTLPGGESLPARRGDRLGLDRDGIPPAGRQPGLARVHRGGTDGDGGTNAAMRFLRDAGPDRRRDGSAVVLLDHAHLRLERRGRRRGGDTSHDRPVHDRRGRPGSRAGSRRRDAKRRDRGRDRHGAPDDGSGDDLADDLGSRT